MAGLKPETVKRLETLGELLDGDSITLRRIRADLKPITGTKLIHEWQVKPYRSLSPAARAITGTHWNGWIFFGLESRRGTT